MGAANYLSDEMDGVQVGIVNISHGSPLKLGLINWAVDGRTEVVARSSSDGFLGGELHNGGPHHHNSYLLDYNPWRRETRVGLGLGLHFALGGKLALDLDSAVFEVLRQAHEGAPAKPREGGAELDVRLAIQLVRHLDVIAGPGVEYRYGADKTASFAHGLGWSSDPNDSGKRSALWPVLSLGFRLTIDEGVKPPAAAPPTPPPPAVGASARLV